MVGKLWFIPLAEKILSHYVIGYTQKLKEDFFKY